MPLIDRPDYKPPFLLFNGHLQTIYPSLFRSVKVKYERERIKTPDDDFLDLDWSRVLNSKKLVILSHGLEGDSNRQYIIGMVNNLNKNGYNALAWNYRGCSGEMNKNYRFYHSGSSDDLKFVIDYILSNYNYDEVYLIGFSLGGNITLKYIGETRNNLDKRIKKGMAISVPCDLSGSAKKMALLSNKIYMQRFINQLKKKLIDKKKQFPDKISIDNYYLIKSFHQFDDQYTAPIHGFKDAEEYYLLNSSIYFLDTISIPTLILNAKNDPFLSSGCFPYEQAKKSKFLFLETPEQGGHCGFPYKKDLSYSEKRALEWIGN